MVQLTQTSTQYIHKYWGYCGKNMSRRRCNHLRNERRHCSCSIIETLAFPYRFPVLSLLVRSRDADVRYTRANSCTCVVSALYSYDANLYLLINSFARDLAFRSIAHATTCQRLRCNNEVMSASTHAIPLPHAGCRL